MDMGEMKARVEKLEYHQRLLLGMIQHTDKAFDLLVIKYNLSEQEVEGFLELCEKLNKDLKKLKADHFVYYTPLFQEFTTRLNKKLSLKETITACIKQGIYVELMNKLLQNMD
ncbi:DUF1878 family protein [Siminovitchia sp. FSL H7-0308]|uniref:GTPase n=1 Tax=Siminovitchia thermophila TaxID=1245522 RepID=A0ABS2R5Z4_9BACI|nr:DUF1878 family protein [Siminovitchia thermophila]MBM7715075.1 putative GTPase [Siminovitchia thermophila]